MSEYIKDPSAPEGWRTISYEKKGRTLSDSANPNADAMEEVAENEPGDVEPERHV